MSGFVAQALSVRFGGKAFPVASVQDAAQKWEAFREASCEGVSTIGNGLTVRDAKGKIVATVSYNGRIWNPDGTEMLALAEEVQA